MRLLFFGDVVGRTGREALGAHLPDLRRRLAIDFTVVNGENAAHGFGITKAICGDFFALGVDVITTGNHVWDQREILGHIDSEKRLLRPLNVPPETPGAGLGVYLTEKGRKVLVTQVMGRLFMGAADDPFAALKSALAKYRLGGNVDAIIVDIHGEASSEKQAVGVFLDGRVSMVVGSHTHVPTADSRILPGGTAFQTDAGMCGDYDSVIGMNKQTALGRFLTFTPRERLQPATGPGCVCGLFVETDDKTGLARHVSPVRIGPGLIETVPVRNGESKVP